jgi:hypothetical protein
MDLRMLPCRNAATRETVAGGFQGFPLGKGSFVLAMLSPGLPQSPSVGVHLLSVPLPLVSGLFQPLRCSTVGQPPTAFVEPDGPGKTVCLILVMGNVSN